MKVTLHFKITVCYIYHLINSNNYLCRVVEFLYKNNRNIPFLKLILTRLAIKCRADKIDPIRNQALAL